MNKFNIQDTVFLITDLEKAPRLICKYEVSLTGIVYFLQCGSVGSWHYDFEFEKYAEKPSIGLK